MKGSLIKREDRWDLYNKTCVTWNIQKTFL